MTNKPKRKMKYTFLFQCKKKKMVRVYQTYCIQNLGFFRCCFQLSVFCFFFLKKKWARLISLLRANQLDMRTGRRGSHHNG